MNINDYHIIPIGDHCAVSMCLKQLSIRKYSYPFDWTSTIDELYKTNILFNLHLINKLNSNNIEEICKEYLGDAFYNETNINTNLEIHFPHDTGNINEIFEKYERRFTRLFHHLYEKKCIFIFITRIYYIESHIFDEILKIIMKFNKNNIILFISGKNHTYFNDNNYSNVIFKYIYYDISKYYNYDYDVFRPSIVDYLSKIFL